MNKRIVRLISFLLLAMMCMAALSSCMNFDKAEEKLREAGYTIIRTGKGAPEHLVDSADEDVVSSLKATGGPNGEWVTVIKFKDKDTAKKFEELEKKANETKYFMTVERDGKTVIYGWTSAYNVIK